MSDAQPATNRPTKKQRKALAHKERARLKKEHALDLDANGLPATDNDQRHEDVAGQQDPDSVTLPTAPKSILKKRKRDDDTEIPAGDVSEVKKPKQLPSGDEGENQDGQEQPEPQKKRYILFVGNLSYSTTPDQIVEHFTIVPLNATKRPKPPSVRMLTKQGESSSKGCAFVEFDGPGSLQRALKLDGTEFQGRKVRVELTVGGGGSKAGRAAKLKAKNKKIIGKRDAAYKAEVEARADAGISRRSRGTGKGPTGTNSTSKFPTHQRGKPPPFASTGPNAIAATRKWGT